MYDRYNSYTSNACRAGEGHMGSMNDALDLRSVRLSQAELHESRHAVTAQR